MKKISIVMCSVIVTAVLTGCSTINGNSPNKSNEEHSSALESVDSLSANNSDNSSYITDSQESTLEHIESYTTTPLVEIVTSTPQTTPIVTTSPPISATSAINTSYAIQQTTIDIQEQTSTTQPNVTNSSITQATSDTTTTLDTNIQLSADEKEVIELVNLERSKNGLQALTSTPEMAAIAQLRAKELVELFSDEHTRPDGRGFDTILEDYSIKYSDIGENIAKDCLTPDDVMNEWLNSPSQRENILNSSYQNIGVARYEYEEKVYWVQFFYTP